MTDHATEAPDFAAMSAPGEQHKLLEPFAGTFAAEVRLWMGPGDPHVSTGVMKNTWDLGGRFLHQFYTGDAQEGPFPNFEGRGYWGYNKTTGKYEGFWIDSASTMMQTDVGTVDGSGKVWTMLSEVICGPTGQPMQKKSIITLKSRNEHSMEMFFLDEEGKETRAMEIRYQRTA